jgi:hypothetical protein
MRDSWKNLRLALACCIPALFTGVLAAGQNAPPPAPPKRRRSRRHLRRRARRGLGRELLKFLIELARDCDLLIHECTFPQQAIDYRSKAGIGTWAHTSPQDLGKIAVAARAKSLVATHFGHFDTTNPVLKKHLARHMPIDGHTVFTRPDRIYEG